jgi:hypothetical protein
MAIGGGATEGPEQRITEQEASSLAQKLEAWSKTLPPAERALLTLIIHRAQESQEKELHGVLDLSAANSSLWLRPWAASQALSFIDRAAFFAKDTGPSWVNSPRRAAAPPIR